MANLNIPSAKLLIPSDSICASRDLIASNGAMKNRPTPKPIHSISMIAIDQPEIS